MIRLAVLALFAAGVALASVGCTHTVRGLGQDLNSQTIQNYNSRTATNLD